MMAITVVKVVLGAVAPYLIALALAAYLAHSYKQYSKLKAFRGPPTSGWSNFWLVRAVTRQNTHIDFANVCQKYGRQRRTVSELCCFQSSVVIHNDVCIFADTGAE